MLTADQFWPKIASLNGLELKTLARGRPFDVISVSKETVTLSPVVSGVERMIPRTDLEEAFQALLQRRELTTIEIAEEISTFNATYISALLAALPDVAVCQGPVRLIFMGHQLFYLE